MVKEKFWKGFRIMLHILGCVIFMYGFSRINIIRFYPLLHPYYEIIFAALNILVGYSFFFYFVKKYYVTGYFVKFWIIFFLSIVVLTGVEMALLFPEYKNVQISGLLYYRRLLWHSISLIFLRDTAWVGLLITLRMNHYYRKNYIQEKIINAQANSIYNITNNHNTITLNISEIVAIQHQKNYTFFYLSDGRKYSQYISLVKVEESMPEGFFIRVSRSALINTKFHYTYDAGMLYLNENFASNINSIGVELSKHYKKEVLEKILV